MAGPPTAPDKSSLRASSPSPQTPSPTSLTDQNAQTRLALAAQAQRNLAVAAACAAEMASKSPRDFGDGHKFAEDKTRAGETPKTDTPKTAAAATGSTQGKGSVRNMIKMFENSGGSGKTPDRKVSTAALRGSAGTTGGSKNSGSAVQRSLPLRQMFDATTPTPESKVALNPLSPSSTESSASTVVYMGAPSPGAPTRQGPRALPEPPTKSRPSPLSTSPRPHLGVKSPQGPSTNSSRFGTSQDNTRKEASPTQPPAAKERPPYRTRALKKLQRATAMRVAKKESPPTGNAAPPLPGRGTRAPTLSAEDVKSPEEFSRMLDFGPGPAIKTPSTVPAARSQQQTSSNPAAGRRQPSSSFFPSQSDPRHRRPVRADPNSKDPLAAVKARQISPCTTTSASYYSTPLPPQRRYHGRPESAAPPRRYKDGAGGEDDLARLRYQKYLTNRPLGRCLDPPDADEGRTIVRAVTAPVTVGGGESSDSQNPPAFSEDPLASSSSPPLLRASVGALSFTSRVSSASSSVYSTDSFLQTQTQPQHALPPPLSPTPAPLRPQASVSAFWDMVRLNLQPTPSDSSSRRSSVCSPVLPGDGPQHQQQQQQGQRQRSSTDKGKGKQRSVDADVDNVDYHPVPKLYSSSAPHPFQTTHHRTFHPPPSASFSKRRPSATTSATATSRGRSTTTATATTATSSSSGHPGSPLSSSSGRGYASGNYVSNPGRSYSRSHSGGGGGGMRVRKAPLARQMSSEEKLRDVDSFFDEPDEPAPGGAKWI